MSKRKDGQARGQYTLEYKLEVVRLVKGGQAVPVTANIMGVPTQTLGNWVRLGGNGQLKGAGDKPASQEQMELARLRAELSRVKMERAKILVGYADGASISELMRRIGVGRPMTYKCIANALVATVVGLKDSYHRSYEPREPCRAVLLQPRGSALPSGETLP